MIKRIYKLKKKSHFINNFANFIFLLGILFSVLLIFYGIYKIYKFEEQNFPFIYIWCILSGVASIILFIAGIKQLKDKLRVKLSVFLFLVGILAYGYETYNEFFIKDNYNFYFGKDRFNSKNYYGGSYAENKNENNYTFFSSSGMDFIVINLGWEPSINEIKWANDLLKAHKNHRAIVVSHYILTSTLEKDFSPQGQKIYNNLKDNPNLFLMLSGHTQGQNNRTDIYKYKNGISENVSIIFSLLSDFTLRGGGDGWLQILKFSPKDNVIRVKTYSPLLKKWERDENSEFTLPYIMDESSLSFDGSAKDFTIIVLPDTQIYSKKFPSIFDTQINWIVENYQKLNIVYVAHVGDIVDDQSSTIQWINASKAMMILENVISEKFPDGIPYGVVPGNHDLLLKPKKISRRILNVLKLTIVRIKFYAFFIQNHDH